MGLFRFLQGVARITATIAALGTILTLSRQSHAQASISVTTINITRSVGFRADQTKRYYVSRADCLADDIITFPIILSGYSGYNLEVWATQSADDCSNATYRTTATATCWRVYSTLPASPTPSVDVKVRDFAAKPPTTEGQGVGTEASCSSTTSTAQPVTLYFLLVQGTTSAANAMPWATSVDLLGPAPPVVGTLGAGGQLLKASWTASSDGEVIAYRVFCEKLTPEGCSDAGTGGAGGTGGASGTGGTGGTGGASGTGGTSGTDGGGGTAGASEAGTNDAQADVNVDANDDVAETSPSVPQVFASPANGDVGDADCTKVSSTTCASSLVAGTSLSLDQLKQFDCGTATGVGSNSLTIKGLLNDQRYAVAVAAVDGVENVGPLSVVQCETPQKVRGFDEEYANAGGTAGGTSFCSLSLGSPSARGRVGLGLVMPTLVGLLLGLRRRRRSSRVRRSAR